MNKFIAFTFLMLGLGFYQMSGGANFVPQTQPIAQIAIVTEIPLVVPFDARQVTRAATPKLPNFTDTAEIIPASLEITPIQPEIIADLREVSGARVNMRTGPGTNYMVLDTLTRGTQTEVIEVNTNGWARIRVSTTNQVGWMAASLLSDS